MRTMVVRCLLGAALSYPLLVWASDPIYTPARLLEDERSIEALLQIPSGLPNGLYTVQCKTWIMKSGRPWHFACRSDQKLLHDLVRSVEFAGGKAWFVPATRNGGAVEARMLVTVRVYVTSEGPLTLAVPNSGTEVDKYGLLYTAPQRLTRIDWPAIPHDAIMKDSTLLWAVLLVDERGKVMEFGLKNASHTDTGFAIQFRAQLGTLRFIPGSFEGKPASMMYVEPFYSEGDDYY